MVATEERNVNMSMCVTMEHCFKDEGKQETTKKRKTPRWLLCNFKDIRKNYMKGKIYIKQQLLKDSFEVKRYSKGILVQIKGEEMYKISINRAFTGDEDSLFEKIEPHKFNSQWGTIYSRDLVELQKKRY